MSETIENRVVEMSFNNKNFEKNVSTTMGTLEKLKNRIFGLSSTSKSFDNINKASKNVSFDNLSSSIDKVKINFSAMEVVAITAISNITNSMINFSKKMIKTFSIDPILSGFAEYETQINSVQTILANTSSKGTSLKEVNAALDELNRYADKTIYNFTEMTRNIGTFTAAGVDLKTAVGAIQGIANLAAVSGSTSQQASTAMYQLSQALAAGTVKLMDWNSVVNAGMGGEVFQNALKETARLHGIAIDQMIKDQGSFRETLQEGWLSADILTETLNKFTTSGANEYIAEYTGLTQDAVKAEIEFAKSKYGEEKAIEQASKALAEKSGKNEKEINDVLQMAKNAEDAATKVKTFTQLFDTLKEAVQSGWTQTWETIIGDFEEARELFTYLSDFFGNVINKMSERRNNFISSVFDKKTLNLEDWNSLVNSGIASNEFEKALVNAAKKHEIAIDDMIAKEGSFRNTLKSGWLDIEILNTAIKDLEEISKISSDSIEDDIKKTSFNLDDLKKVANEVLRGDWNNGQIRRDLLSQAGYDPDLIQKAVNDIASYGKITDQTSKKLEEVTKKIANLSDEEASRLGITKESIEYSKKFVETLNDENSALNKLIKNMSKPSGRELLINSIKNSLEGFSKIFGAISDSFNDFIPKVTEKQVYNFLVNLEKLTSKLKLSDENAKNLKTTFDGLFSVLGLFYSMFTTITNGISKLALALIPELNGGLFKFTSIIGKSLVNLTSIIKRIDIFNLIINKLETKIRSSVKAIQEWIIAFSSSEYIKDILADVNEKIYNFMNNQEYYLNLVIKKFKEYYNTIRNLDRADLEEILKNFKNNIKDLLSDTKNLENVTLKIKSILTNIYKAIIESFEKIGIPMEGFLNKLDSFLKNLRNKLSNINIGSIISLLLESAIVYGFVKLSSSLFKITKILSLAVGDFINAFSSLVDSLNKYIRAKAFTETTKGIMNIAIAVGILAASLIALTLVDPKKIKTAAITIISLLLAVSAITAAMGILSKKDLIGNDISLSMLSVAGSLALIALAISTISKIEIDDVGEFVLKILAMTAILGALVTFTAILSKYSKGLVKNSYVFLPLAASLVLIAKALKELTGIDANGIGNAAFGLISMVGMLSVLIFAIKKLKFGIKDALGLSILAISLKIFISLFSDLANLSNKIEINDFGKFIKISTSLFLSLIGLLLILKLSGKYAAAGGVGLLALSAALYIMTAVIKQIDNVSKNDINKLIQFSIGLSVAFAIMLASTKLAGQSAIKSAASLLLMAGAIGILSLVISSISKIKPADMTTAIVAITSIGLLFAILLKASQYATGSLKSIIAISVAMTVLSLSLGILSLINWKALLPATLALTMVMGMFALILVAGKSATLSIPSILIITAVIGLIGGMFYLLRNLDPKTTLSIAASISLVLLSLSASMAICTMIPAAAALQGALSFVTFVGVLGALAIGIGYLLDLLPDDAINKMDKAIKFVQKVGELIGAFIGGLVGGTVGAMAESVSSFLPGMANNLSEFSENITPFIDKMSSIDEGFEGKIKVLVSAISSLVSSGIWDKVGSLFSKGQSPLVELGNNLSSFSNSITDFVSMANIQNIETAVSNAEKIIGIANNIPNSGGFLSKNKSLSDYGKELSSFADSISDFTSMEISNVDNIVSSVNTLFQLMSSVNIDENSVYNFNAILESILSGFQTYGQKFYDSGSEIGIKLSNGILARRGMVISASQSLSNSGVSVVRNSYGIFYSAGANCGQAIASGLLSATSAVYSAGASLGQSANRGFNDYCQIHSPSRLFFNSAVFAGLGIIKGFENISKKVYESGSLLGESSYQGFSKSIMNMSKLINNSFDDYPVIKPVLDISEIQNGVKSISSIITSKKIPMSATINRAKSINSASNNINDSAIKEIGTGNIYNNFTQNNYSPKALSRIEIYRQTKNLISAKR